MRYVFVAWGISLLSISAFAADFVPRGPKATAFFLGHGGPTAEAVAAAVTQTGVYLDTPASGVGICGRCHPDVAQYWSASPHRMSSFNNPYYAAAFDVFRQDRPADGGRFCANCHDPALVIAGTVETVDRRDPSAQTGISCLTCHSIDAAHAVRGNGEFHAKLDPVPIRSGHSARVTPQGDLCGTCHRVGLTKAITGDRWLRGQDEWFDWTDSGAAGRGVSAVRQVEPRTCVDCHMPRVPASARERGAKGGMIRLHRFAASNSALAHLRDDPAQLDTVREMLKGAVTLDLLSTRKGTIDVVLTNARVGHRFPAGTMDSNEVWIELVARDKSGVIVRHSGVLDQDGLLPEDAHRLLAQLVDSKGVPIQRRDAQNIRGVVFNTSIPPAESRVVRYRIPVNTHTVEARLRYRKFNLEYARFACADLPDTPTRQRCLSPPIIEVSQATVTLDDGLTPPASWQKNLAHGLGLAAGLSDHVAEAIAPLERAAEAAPDRVEPRLGLVRVAMRLGQTDAALAQLDVIDRRPDAPISRHWLRAKVLTQAYRNRAALPAAEALLKAVPDDRRALALVARLRGLLGDAEGSLAAADRLIAVDPEHPSGWFHRMLALRDLKRPIGDSEDHWLRHRVADETNLELLRLFRAKFPGRAKESIGVHTH